MTSSTYPSLCEMFIQIPSDVIIEMRRPQTAEGPKCLLWFGACHVDNFDTQKRANISKLGVSSGFQAKFHHSGYLEINKEKGYILFRTRWDKISVPPLPRDLVELLGRIRNEFAFLTRDMLVPESTEMEYRNEGRPYIR
ncbi:uncharacterized protein TNCV_2741301 [Trichonephila clavipes]|nr:uncharacterized protein TNCV_2741301 [Trichonephila clavipes]